MQKFIEKTFINRDVNMTTSDWIVDVVIAIGVFGISLAQLTVTASLLIPDPFIRRMLGISIGTPSLYAFVVIASTSVPLVFRRKFSWITYAVCLLVWVYYCFNSTDSVMPIIPLLIALVSLCAMRPMEDAFVASLIAFIVVGFLPLLTSRTILTNLMLVQNMALVFAGAGIGVAFRTTRDLIHSAELRVKRTEEAAKATTEKRLEEERVAIARELHDITAHSLSAISIQAAAAEAQINMSPEEAKQTVIGIRKISKDSLAEIRRMIGVLREPTDVNLAPELMPSMGTEELHEIEEYLHNAKIECKIIKNNYSKQEVPTFVDIAIFGICREAATNIVKHSHAKFVTIELNIHKANELESQNSISRFSDYVELKITDDGVGLGGDLNKSQGHGVEGMRERCVALGGEFEIKNGVSAGVEIDVVLPVRVGGEA